MELDSPEQPRPDRRPRARQNRVAVALIALLLVVVVSLALLYWPTSPFRPRHVNYDYSVVIEADSSDEFLIICPLPADYVGTVCSDVVPSIGVEGNAIVTEVTTPYGDGLQVEGTGSAVITWTYSFTYRSSTQGVYDHYSNLSMLSDGYELYGAYAFIFSEDADTNLSLVYAYAHVYGTLGADWLRYQVSGNLTNGWNELPVDLDWIVS